MKKVLLALLILLVSFGGAVAGFDTSLRVGAWLRVPDFTDSIKLQVSPNAIFEFENEELEGRVGGNIYYTTPNALSFQFFAGVDYEFAPDAMRFTDDSVYTASYTISIVEPHLYNQASLKWLFLDDLEVTEIPETHDRYPEMWDGMRFYVTKRMSLNTWNLFTSGVDASTTFNGALFGGMDYGIIFSDDLWLMNTTHINFPHYFISKNNYGIGTWLYNYATLNYLMMEELLLFGRFNVNLGPSDLIKKGAAFENITFHYNYSIQVGAEYLFDDFTFFGNTSVSGSKGNFFNTVQLTLGARYQVF